MKNYSAIVDDKLQKYYQEGYDKGRDDAFRGIRMKVMQRTLIMRYEHLREWERGYCDGYLAANN